MHRDRSSRRAFTLIEVMIAVMIVSVVIAALLEIQANTNNKFMQIQKIMHSNQYNSFLLSQREHYGFERSSSDMYSLLEDFDLVSDLRRRLSATKIEIEYTELDIIDTSKFMGGSQQDEPQEGRIQEGAQNAGIVFEIGRSQLISTEGTSSLIRVRVQ